MKTDKNGESSIFQKALAVSPAVHRQSGTSKDLLDAVKQEDIVLLAAVNVSLFWTKWNVSFLLALSSTSMQRKMCLFSPEAFPG